MWDKMKFIASKAWDFLWPIIKQLLSKEGPILMALAAQAVAQAQQQKSLSGGEKRAYAFNIISIGLKDEGIKVGTSLINSLIESAVQSIK